MKFLLGVLTAGCMLAGLNVLIFIAGKTYGEQKVLDNMTNFCYNGAIVQGTNGKMFMCRGVELGPEEKKQLGLDKSLVV